MSTHGAAVKAEKKQRALTPAAIMRPVIMECVVGRRRVDGVTARLCVRLVAAVPRRFFQRQRKPLTFVTWRRLHTENTASRLSFHCRLTGSLWTVVGGLGVERQLKTCVTSDDEAARLRRNARVGEPVQQKVIVGAEHAPNRCCTACALCTRPEITLIFTFSFFSD